MSAVVKGNLLLYKGSSFFRQRLVLSVLSGKPVQITEIRDLEDEPGLKEYEISLVRLLDKITNGTTVELNETGTSIYFQPGMLHGGVIEHNCSNQRAIGYYLEVLFMVGFYCKQPLIVTLQGVTCNDIDPSVDQMKTSMMNAMKKFVLDDEGLELKIRRRGMMPNGGGEVIFKCPIRSQTRPVNLVESGLVKRIRGTAYALRVSPAIANRMVEKAKGVLLNFIPDIYIHTDQCKGKNAGKSPGFGIHLLAETTKGCFYSAEQVSKVRLQNEDPSVPEDVGVAAAQRLLYEIYLGGIVESTAQTLSILFMALGPKDVSKMVVGPLSDNSIWFLRHLKEFFGVTFKIENYRCGGKERNEENDDSEEEDDDGRGSEKVLLTCVGVGYINLSKKTF